MSAGFLARLLGLYVAVIFIASIVLAGFVGVDRAGEAPRSLVSVWVMGQRRARAAVSNELSSTVDADTALLRETRQLRGTRVVEDVIDTGPVLSMLPLIFGASFVPGTDGIEARYGNKVAYASADDLLAWKAYDHPVIIGPIRLQLGVDPDVALDALAHELGVPRQSLEEYGRFRRLSLRRREPPNPTPKVTRETLKEAVVEATRYLARSVHEDGSYRYEVNAIDNTDSEGYNWPRHAGATWFLAEGANYAQEPALLEATQRAARRLADTVVACGEHRCVAEGERADLGSSALGLLALTEVVEGGQMPELKPVISQLAEFLRSQQRKDGEFKHFYNREKNEPVDQQVLYYTGEASFALSRASRVTHDKRDLDAASRALEHLVSYPPWYIGWHYFWGSEHWTCHALEDLWERAPSKKALSFCLDWQEAVRKTAIFGREASPAYDGATSAGPFVPPALVGTATRMEAGVATLRVARLAGVSAGELARLEKGVEEGLAFLLRFQFNPGLAHLMPLATGMRGGFPNTPTDYRVRIDYPQHAGTALVAYLKQLERRGGGK